MQSPNPYHPPEQGEIEVKLAEPLRWRMIPVRLFAFLCAVFLVIAVGQLFNFSYLLLAGIALEKRNRGYAPAFLCDAGISLLQSLLLGIGTFLLWKRIYPLAIQLLVAGVFLRKMLDVMLAA